MLCCVRTMYTICYGIVAAQARIPDSVLGGTECCQCMHHTLSILLPGTRPPNFFFLVRRVRRREVSTRSRCDRDGRLRRALRASAHVYRLAQCIPPPLYVFAARYTIVQYANYTHAKFRHQESSRNQIRVRAFPYVIFYARRLVEVLPREIAPSAL